MSECERGERRRESFHVNVPFYTCARAETQYMCRGCDRHTRHVRKNNVRCADIQYICKSYKIEIHHNIRDIYIYLSIDLSICLYIHPSAYLFIYLQIQTYIDPSNIERIHISMHAMSQRCMYVHVYECVCVCVCAPYTISLQPCPLLHFLFCIFFCVHHTPSPSNPVPFSNSLSPLCPHSPPPSPTHPQA